MAFLIGSICLSDIPRELIKKVETRDGAKLFLNIAVGERKTPSKMGSTHYVSCAPKKADRKDGVNYYIGDLKEWQDRQPTTEDIDKAPAVDDDEVLPF